MARLPEIRPQSAFTPIPQRTETAAGSGFAALAEVFSAISKVTAPIAMQEAAASGAEAVSRDADGNLVANTRVEFTPIDEAYNAAARSIYVTEMDGDVQARVAAMSEQFYNDPVSFQSAVKEYRTEVMKTVPTVFKGDVAQMITQRAGIVNNQIIRESYRETRTKALNANTSRIASINDQMEQLASDPTPENMEAIAQLKTQRDELQAIRLGLPGSYYTQEQAEYENQQQTARILNAHDTAVNAAVDNAEAMLSRGEVPPDLDRVRELAQGTDRAEGLESLVLAQTRYPTFATKTPDERAAVIADLRADGVQPDELRLIDALEAQDASIKEMVDVDAIGYAQKLGEPVPALNPSDPLSYENRMKLAVEKARQGNNPKGQILTGDEVTAIRTIIKDGHPEEVISTIASLGQFGREGMNAAWAQIGVDPEMRGVIEMVSGGADPAITTSAVAGMRLGKAKRGLDDADRTEGISNVMGEYQATLSRPNVEAQRQKVAMADAIYADMVENNGAEPGRDTWESALQQSLGGKDGIGGLAEVGSGRVTLPPDVPKAAAEGAFTRIMNEYYDVMLGGAVAAAQFDNRRGNFENPFDASAAQQSADGLARQTVSDRLSAISRSGGFPTYRGAVPDYDVLADVEVKQVGADSYIMTYRGIPLLDSGDSSLPYTFSMRAMAGVQ